MLLNSVGLRAQRRYSVPHTLGFIQGGFGRIKENEELGFVDHEYRRRSGPPPI